MDSSLEDVLRADMVFAGIGLIDTPDAFERFKVSLDNTDLQAEIGRVTNVSGPISGIGDLPDTAYKFTLIRDRITLEILPNVRASIAKEYPSIAEGATDFERLAEVIRCGIDSTDSDIDKSNTFGYNMRLVFAPNLTDTATYYLGNKLFGSQSLGKEGWKLIGGMGTLIFEDGARNWTVNVEPRPRDDYSSMKIYLHLNLHFQDAELPSYEEIIATFDEMKVEADRFMAHLI